MFPITLSSVGDIIAVAQLFSTVVTALRESTGAAQHHRDFVYELEALASVLDDAGRHAHRASNNKSQNALLDAVRHCCSDLERASTLTSGFEALLRTDVSEAPCGSDAHGSVARGAKKLRWHFMKKSEAADFTQRFQRWCSLIHLRITLLDDDTAQSRHQEQRAYEEASASLIRDDIALSLESTDVHQRKVEHLLGDETAQSRDQQQRAHVEANTALIRCDIARVSRSSSAHQHEMERLHRAMDDAKRQSLESSTHNDVRARLIIFPVCAMAAVFILANPALISPSNPVHRYSPWLALCVVVVHTLLQAVSIPSTVGYTVESSVIFIDFVGETMNLPPQLCGTMDDVCSLIDIMFRKAKRKGWSFVRAQTYEIIETSSSSALTPSTWSTLVKVGVKIQLGVLVRRKGSEREALVCPYCRMVVFRQGPMVDSSDWFLCERCGRAFQASAFREDNAVQIPSPRGSGVSNSDSPLDQGSICPSATHHSEEPGPEDLKDFELVHILSIITATRAPQPSLSAITTSPNLAALRLEEEAADLRRRLVELEAHLADTDRWLLEKDRRLDGLIQYVEDVDWRVDDDFSHAEAEQRAIITAARAPQPSFSAITTSPNLDALERGSADLRRQVTG